MQIWGAFFLLQSFVLCFSLKSGSARIALVFHFGTTPRDGPFFPVFCYPLECIDEVKKFQLRHLYIGRGGPHLNKERSFWANPFKVSQGGRKQAITQHEGYVRKKEEMLERIPQLQDKVLVCHCRVDEACYADVSSSCSMSTSRT